MKTMNKEMQSAPTFTFSAFIGRVKDILIRHACYGLRMLIAVLRRLRERGFWPWKRSVRPEAVCGEVARRMKAEKPQAATDGKPAEAKTSNSYGTQVKDTTLRMKDYLLAHYDLRYNVADGVAEMRRKDAEASDAPFVQVGGVLLNTIVLELHGEGIPVWDRDVARLLQSLALPQHHPLADYLARLPQWDGTDRLTPLARRVSDDALWTQAFSCWMRAMVAQWRACTDTDGEVLHTSNQLAPILISREQGLHKSSFCRMLVPKELRTYFTDKFELDSRANLDYPLCRHALVNLDEFDRYSSTQLTRLKNLMQLGTLNVRRPHARHYEMMHRTASFIGTSNTGELLTDPTGSRRFFCQMVDHIIDCDTPLNHDQLYAQLAWEIDHDYPHFLDKETEVAVQRHNRLFYKSSPLREAFLQLFDFTCKSEEECGGRWMSATEIYHALQQHFGTHLLQGTPAQLGRQLTFVGAEKKHTERGSLYFVRKLGGDDLSSAK